MKLDRLLSNVGVRVEPFAVCDIHRGYRLRLPTASETLLHFVADGRGRLVAGGRQYPICAQTLIVIPSGLPHSFESDTSVEEELTIGAVDTELFSKIVAGPQGSTRGVLLMSCGRITATFGEAQPLFGQLREPIVRRFDADGGIRHAFSELHREHNDQLPGSLFMQELLMSQVLVHLFRVLCECEDCPLPWLGALADDRLGRAVDRILAGPADPHTLESLAEAAGMSRSAFAAQFSNAFDKTAMEFLRDVRLRRAAALLCQTNLPIKNIAAQVGFRSRSHFSRAFKELFAQEPSVFRTTSAVDGRTETQ